MRLKPGWIILIIIALVLAGWGIAGFIEYRRPPELTFSAPLRAPAGELFEVRVSSNKDLEMNLSWDEVQLTGSGSDWSVFLPAQPGQSLLQLEVTDRAGNRLTEQQAVDGVAAPELTLLSAEALTAGDPLAGLLLIDQGDNTITDVSFQLAGEELGQLSFDGNRVGLVALPLSLQQQELTLMATVTDEFGRTTVAERSYTVQPVDRPVEVLQLAPEVLALQTAENSRLQAERFAEASADPEPDPLWNQPFLLPMQGFGSSGYADPRRYFDGGDVSFHLGTDLAAPTGTPIRATNDGVVILAENLPLAGGAVVIDHGAGVTSRYYHQSLILTQVGARVQRGDIIGEVGSTGISTGPHLHWEMRINGEPSNPLQWVDRLLPGIDGL